MNGNFVVSMSKKEINIQGAIFEYSGSNSSIERINSTDRLEEEVVLQVNSQESLIRLSFNPISKLMVKGFAFIKHQNDVFEEYLFMN